MYGMYYSWWDPTYFLVIIGAVICLDRVREGKINV